MIYKYFCVIISKINMRYVISRKVIRKSAIIPFLFLLKIKLTILYYVIIIKYVILRNVLIK